MDIYQYNQCKFCQTSHHRQASEAQKSRRLEFQTPFGQGHEVNEQSETGTGLGLPIVKQLIMLHNGNFVLVSKVGVGTRVTITIPEFRRR
ncbi:MAG: ATP-binding protein [Emcibacteraceae bacterium]|nr:ATP-binding protein [Emcibacteraceae bacterium]